MLLLFALLETFAGLFREAAPCHGVWFIVWPLCKDIHQAVAGMYTSQDYRCALSTGCHAVVVERKTPDRIAVAAYSHAWNAECINQIAEGNLRLLYTRWLNR